MNEHISEEMLSAYLDKELAPAECNVLLESMATDGTLRTRACELWQLQQMLRGAYPLPPKKSVPAARPFAGTGWAHALAASLLLMVGCVSGWFMNEHNDDTLLSPSQLSAIQADGGRVVLHLFSDEPQRMEVALRKAEQLANAHNREGRPLRVEFIANGPGIHLLRSGGSPYAERLAALQQGHANLRLLACSEAIERMHERGLDVVLLPGVGIARSAESQLAERLTQGWRYVQV
jgi:intracellular sulfur oxidation DsrE/DsrF family protein